MKLTSFKRAGKIDQSFLLLAKQTAGKSVAEKKHRVGCILLCADKSLYKGATITRTRVIGSTCAERMALDSWYFNGKKSVPSVCYLVGTLDRKGWSNDYICTPCGVCLEMFLSLLAKQGVKHLEFVCANWTLSRVLRADLGELFPQIGKGSN